VASAYTTHTGDGMRTRDNEVNRSRISAGGGYGDGCGGDTRSN